MKPHFYLCIDLKSFYASVECAERGLDAMEKRLVVADPSRSDKTICLAVTPAMKALGVNNRCRLFEIPKHIDYIIAVPRMQKYIDYAAEIYGIYLKYFSKNDIYIYSVDEAFIDVTDYLKLYKMKPQELAKMLMDEISTKLKIRSTCGIGTNLYLAKIALDIIAKHARDFIGILDEKRFKKELWLHRPLTDFWHIGHRTEARLNRMGIYTMKQIAFSDPERLYREFGINAELMMDHAWGIEPVTIEDIKAYRPQKHSLCSGQVLMRDYDFDEGAVVVREMADQLCLDMVEKKLIVQTITMHVGYSRQYNQLSARGSFRMDIPTNAGSIIIPKTEALYRRIVDPAVPIRRMTIGCQNVCRDDGQRQISFFSSEAEMEKEYHLQKEVIGLKKRFGKNAVLKALDLQKGATAIERNEQIGGHRSGEKDKEKNTNSGTCQAVYAFCHG